jgi:hypothetical protein
LYHYGFYMGDPGFLLVIGAILLGLVAQGLVSRTYARYSEVRSSSGLSGAEAARRILDANGLSHVQIRRVAGRLTDHYDPRSGTLSLSDGVYRGRSVSAVGVAAHEAGHAVQHAMGYRPFEVRSTLVPAANLGSRALFPLIIAGFIFQMTELFYIGAALYGAALLFHLVTLPVELDASRRAVAQLRSTGSVTGDDLAGVRKVLGAAAMTYVAAALVAIANMARLLLLGRRR